ncbi:MAG: glutamate-5-semialdehyde dehydrogenase [Polyangiaceae bacterium]|nr:glutamate-5-semialdehyde dehydrogenase [Polyangiaceae bacterium]
MSSVRKQAELARLAQRTLAPLRRLPKDQALAAIAAKLRANVATITATNLKDLERARANGLSEPMLDRLTLGPSQIEATAKGVDYIVSLPDPVGSRSEARRLDNGLLVGQQRLPLGVIAMIYEARPNVTVDAAALCIKSGNAVLLRGGKEAEETNQLLGRLIAEALTECGIPGDVVQIIPATDREGMKELLSLHDLVDLAIPRGGEGLIRFVAENARVPVVKHYQGICHMFLDESADVKKAVPLVINSKAQRPGVCNALECLLVHEKAASDLLPVLGTALREAGVEVRGCEKTRALLPWATPVSESDFGAEFLAKILAVRVVHDLDEALAHIARYGSNHTESICTENYSNAERWVNEVDASCVLVNASTRFNDGGQLGLGAEIGISTSKLHAYGPMGLLSLTAEKWVVYGQGQVRA